MFSGIELIVMYIILIIIIACIGDRIWAIKQRKYFESLIRDKYGKKPVSKKKSVDRETIGSYFKNIKDDLNFYIDNITWHDLNMDDIYKLICNVQSSVGAEVLYKLLRVPVFSKETLDNREEILDYLKNNPQNRFKIQVLIRTVLGKREIAKVSDYFSGVNGFTKGPLYLHLFLRYLVIILIISTPFVGNALPLFPALAIIAMNLGLKSYKAKNKEYVLDDYSYIISMIKCAFKIRNLNLDVINKNYPDIDEALKPFKKLNGKFLDKVIDSIGGNTTSLKLYSNAILLSDSINYDRISDVFYKNPEKLKIIYDYVGEIDSLISISSFRKTLEYYDNPNFNNNLGVSFEKIYNPLLKKPVTNDFSSSKSMLLTGSNASGKSTFLRTVGLNILLSQTINTVCAKNFNTTMFRLYSSMALSDNILGNESYYMVEIKSLKRILNTIDEEYPIFCLVDEILRGTNTVERISASSEILKYMAKSNHVFCLAATHDIELTYMLNDIFDNYSFEEQVIKNKIVFDYKLKTGRSKTRNAIKILEFIGYDKSIIRAADKKAKNYLENKNWNI